MAIIDHYLNQGNQGYEGQQVLVSLLDFWETCKTDPDATCFEAEKIAREREPGDGAPQVTVVDRLNRALISPDET